MGIRTTPAERESYHALWRYAGHLLGVEAAGGDVGDEAREQRADQPRRERELHRGEALECGHSRRRWAIIAATKA